MNYFHKRTMLSSFPNHEDAQAVENAIRTAIHTVVSVISSINSAKIQEYQRKLAEMDKENETLKCRVKKAEREISELRGVFEISGNECQARSSLYTISPEMAGEQHCNKNEVAGKAEWRIDFPSIGAPPQISSHCQNSAPPSGANIDVTHHHQNLSFPSVEQSVFSAVPSKDQSSSPSPVTSPMIKEEPSDIDTFYIKWEMSDECVGGQQEGPKHILGKDKEAHHWGGPPTDGSHSVACSQRIHEYGERPTRHLKWRLSSAETQRRFRERLRADPERYRAYKEKERRRNQQRKVSISDLPEEIRRLKREAWREASRRCRARKMSSLQMNPTQLCHLSPEQPGETEECFRQGMAVGRTFVSLG